MGLLEDLEAAEADRDERKRQAQLRIAEAIIRNEELTADLKKHIEEFRFDIQDLKKLSETIQGNNERLAKIREFETRANELAAESLSHAAKAAALAKVRDEISLQMAENREAAERDFSARNEIDRLAKERKYAKDKLQGKIELIREMAAEQSQLWQEIEELRSELKPVLGAMPASEAVERIVIEVPCYHRPEIVPATPPGMLPLETIPQLLRERVPLEQIAKIYGLHPWEIMAENDSPGFILNRPDFRDPRWEKYEKRQAEKAREQEADEVAEAVEQRYRTEVAECPAKKPRQPCPETPRELWQQGVLIGQAARMLMKSIPEVSEMWDAFDAEESEDKAEQQLAEQEELDRRLAERLGQPIEEAPDGLSDEVDSEPEQTTTEVVSDDSGLPEQVIDAVVVEAEAK